VLLVAPLAIKFISSGSRVCMQNCFDGTELDVNGVKSTLYQQQRGIGKVM